MEGDMAIKPALVVGLEPSGIKIKAIKVLPGWNITDGMWNVCLSALTYSYVPCALAHGMTLISKGKTKRRTYCPF